MRKEFLFAVCSLFIVCFLGACDSLRIYEKNVDFNQRIWLYDSIATFSFDIEDTTQQYNLYYNVRNSLDYPFYNLYLNYELKDSTEALLSSELNNIALFDAKSGDPKGDGLGDVFDHQVLFLQDYRFKSKGTYHVAVQQFMRRDSLPEIMAFGIRVERLEAP